MWLSLLWLSPQNNDKRKSLQRHISGNCNDKMFELKISGIYVLYICSVSYITVLTT